jgi:hypothetical protein
MSYFKKHFLPDLSPPGRTRTRFVKLSPSSVRCVPFAGEKFPSPALKKARSENAYNELWDIMSARANLSFCRERILRIKNENWLSGNESLESSCFEITA